MKKIIILFAWVLAINTCYSQVFKYKAKQFGFISILDWNTGDSILWQPCDVLIVVNIDKNKVNVFSEKERNFDIISSEGKKREYKCWSYEYKAVDIDGEKVGLSIAIWDKDGNKHDATLIVNTGKISYAYNMDLESSNVPIK